jgi:hypothetical protein
MSVEPSLSKMQEFNQNTAAIAHYNFLRPRDIPAQNWFAIGFGGNVKTFVKLKSLPNTLSDYEKMRISSLVPRYILLFWANYASRPGYRRLASLDVNDGYHFNVQEGYMQCGILGVVNALADHFGTPRIETNLVNKARSQFLAAEILRVASAAATDYIVDVVDLVDALNAVCATWKAGF